MSTYDYLDAQAGRIKIVTSLPSTPLAYYGSEGVVGDDQWIGGEVVYHSGDSRLYIQTATSTLTAAWKRLVTQFATSTTSTTTSTSSSSSTTSSSTSSSSTTTS
jgi:hypothetical protein